MLWIFWRMVSQQNGLFVWCRNVDWCRFVVSVWWKPLADNNNMYTDSNHQHHIHIIIIIISSESKIIPFVFLILSSMLEFIAAHNEHGFFSLSWRPTFILCTKKISEFSAKWHISLPLDICINNNKFSSHNVQSLRRGKMIVCKVPICKLYFVFTKCWMFCYL